MRGGHGDYTLTWIASRLRPERAAQRGSCCGWGVLCSSSDAADLVKLGSLRSGCRITLDDAPVEGGASPRDGDNTLMWISVEREIVICCR